MHPGLGRRDRLPGWPLLVCALESILNTILGSGSIAEHCCQRAQDLAVRRLVQPVEVRFVARFIVGGERAGDVGRGTDFGHVLMSLPLLGWLSVSDFLQLTFASGLLRRRR